MMAIRMKSKSSRALCLGRGGIQDLAMNEERINSAKNVNRSDHFCAGFRTHAQPQIKFQTKNLVSIEKPTTAAKGVIGPKSIDLSA